MALNGTLSDEAGALRATLRALGISNNQIVQTTTGLGLGRAPTAEELQETASQLRSELEKLEGETLEDFVAKNKVTHPIPPILLLEGQLKPMSDKDLMQILRDRDGWDRFRSIYPQSSGVVGFSRVGFNASVTQALVFAGKQVDKTKGQGGYTLFEKDDDKWQNIGTAMVWNS
jgi:hypothetical protein